MWEINGIKASCCCRATTTNGKQELWRAVVATTGNRMGDNEAKAADVSLAFGISNQCDENTAPGYHERRFHRSKRHALGLLRKYQSFLQFQLTVNAVALLLTLIAAVVNLPPLNVMLLWMNRIWIPWPRSPRLSAHATLELKPFLRNASLTDKLRRTLSCSHCFSYLCWSFYF